jgi:hypothetical protein
MLSSAHSRHYPCGAMIKIDPTDDHPVPYNTAPEELSTFQDEVVVAANTAEILEKLGSPIEIDTADIDKTVSLFKASERSKAGKELKQPETAFAANLFLKTYANRVAADMHEVRSAITAKLMEIANCGDPRYELKALELLGKHSDIGLFTERSEITINHKSSDDLESAIKERIKRLLNSDVIDVTPISDSLDIELGVADDEPRAMAHLEDQLGEADDEHN